MSECCDQSSEDSLCEACHTEYVGWLMAQDMRAMMRDGATMAQALQAVTVAAYAPGRTPGTDASHPTR